MSGSVSVYDDMSVAEKEVASFLTELRIRWKFEQPVFVEDDKERPRVWSPDFYLPELGLYVEVCGNPHINYSYRKEIYEKNKIPVIFVHLYKDEGKWSNYLIKRIKEIYGERSEVIEGLH